MSKGRAALAISQGMSVWVLEARDGFGDADFHAHHAIQITALLAGNLRLVGDKETVSGQVLAVKAGERHRLEADGMLAFVFIEPECRQGKALTHLLFKGAEIVSLDPEIAAMLLPLANAFDGGPDRMEMLEIGQRAIELLEPEVKVHETDPRVRRIIDYVVANLDGPLSLKDASLGIYLSPSRLRHLFVEQTGLPFKTYLLWLRLVRALEIYSEGNSLTEAAHLAGFSDSAHLSRIFRRTFGLPATTLTRL